MIKVLHVVPTISYCGGIENYVMNYLRNISNEFKFDFAYHNNSELNFKEEIEAKGGNAYKLTEFKIKNLKIIKKEIYNLIKNNSYDIIHVHQANAAFLYLKIAKKLGVKVRILHSHQTKLADKFTHSLRNIPLLKLGLKHANKYVACSNLAGKFLFKNRNYTVINNAVEKENYEYNINIAKNLKDKYFINDDTFVIGQIGRLCPQKNQLFSLQLINELIYKNLDVHLFLVGDGPDKEKLEKEIRNLNLNNNVTFTGSVTNTNEYYNLFDILILPSIYEGLPVVGVEAQYNGLHILSSNNVTSELNFSGNVKYLELKKDLWIKEIKSNLKNRNRKNVDSDLYDIKHQVISLEKYYINSIREL